MIMCLAIPGEVISIDGKRALLDIMGVKKEVSIALLKDVKVGDFVIVHAGCAISVINEVEARETLELFKELGDICNE